MAKIFKKVSKINFFVMLPVAIGFILYGTIDFFVFKQLGLLLEVLWTVTGIGGLIALFKYRER